MIQSRKIPVSYIAGAIVWGILTVVSFSGGDWLQGTCSLFLLLSFALLGLFLRYQIPAMKWTTWVFLAIAGVFQVFNLVNKVGYDGGLL